MSAEVSTRSRRRYSRPSAAPAPDELAPERAATLHRDLRSCLIDGASFSVMVGMGETFLPAFVLALGLGQIAAGLITTAPLLGGALLQLVSPYAVRRLGSNRRWVVACAVVQALAFMPLVIGAYIGAMPMWAVFATAAVYWGSGLGTGPAWNTWVGTIIPQRIRTRYFAMRTRLTQLGTLFGFVVGGIGLQYARQLDDATITDTLPSSISGAAITAVNTVSAAGPHVLLAFAVMFLVAASCRAVSAWSLSQQSEPEPPSRDAAPINPLEWIRTASSGREGKLLLYLLGVQTAAQISAPYFTPYMLRAIKLEYWQYVVLVAISYAARAVAMPFFGSVAARFGAQRLLWLGGIGIIPLSTFWLFSARFEYLFCVQILAGFTWAAYELAMFLLMLEAIRPEQRTGVLTIYNLANALVTAGGSLLGGALLSLWSKTPEAYLAIFVLSSICRAGMLLLLFRLPKLAVDHADTPPLAMRTIGLRTDDGSMEQPILPSIESE